MTRYSAVVNEELKQLLLQEDPFVLFGQNVSAGSCLSGLTRGLVTSQGLEMFNTPNCENAMVGFGFGMMMRGVNSAFFIKQHDFLLLTLDHMVNTYNMMKLTGVSAGFTIVCIVVDSGFEGPQSRLNNLSDFCSLADIETLAINSVQEAQKFVPLLKAPGFRILALSQRQMGQEMLDIAEHQWLSDTMVQYYPANTGDVFIVSMNFALPQAVGLREDFASRGVRSTIVSISTALPKDFSEILLLASGYESVVIIDDSRSINKSSDRLHLALLKALPTLSVLCLQRGSVNEDIVPNLDAFEVDTAQVYAELYG
jgi:deoxyxylulose-5-phosphate synthase